MEMKDILGFLLLCGLGLITALSGKAQDSGTEQEISSDICLLASANEQASLICCAGKVTLTLSDGEPVRLWLPDLGGLGRREFFLDRASLGDDARDHAFARLDLALAVCAKDDDCRDVARDLRAELVKGCAEPPVVYQRMSVFR